MFSTIVVGDGAVGTAVAVALSSKSVTVTLAGPPGTAEQMRLFSVEGVLSKSAEILHTSVDRISSRAPVIVALKAFSIKQAQPHIERLSQGKIVCLSNGMGLDKEWGDLVDTVEYAVFSMGFRKIKPATVLTTDGVVFCGTGSKAAGIFEPSLIPVKEVADMIGLRWAKWFANSIINPVGALSGLENNRLIQAGFRPLIDRLSIEISECMPSMKTIRQGKKLLDWLLEHSANKCSMLQDIENGYPTEIDYLTGLCVARSGKNCPEASRLVSAIKSRREQAGKQQDSVYSSGSPM